MNNFLELESIYEHLEENALDYKNLLQIADLFQKIRDRMHEKGDTYEETKAQWETDVFNIQIESNIVKPLWTGVNNEGEEIKYPNFERFDDATYDYLIERLESSTNPLLKARYAHILWHSPRRHGRYAQKAIDSYLELIKLYEQEDKESPKDHYGLDVLNAVKNAYFLSVNVKDETRLNIIKSEIKRLIFNFNSESSSLFRLRADSIDLMVKEKKVFCKNDFKDVGKLCFQFADKLKEQGKIHQAITMLELGEKVDIKEERITHNWKKHIAESYEKMMKTRINDSLVAITFCQKALKYYKQTKDSKKIKELEEIYDRLKTSAKFEEFKVEIERKEYVEECVKRAKRIVQQSSEEIIQLLMWDKNLLPKYDKTKALAEKTLEDHPTQTILPTQIFDERGNIVQHFSSDEEMIYYNIIKKYRLNLESQYFPLINAIMFECLKERKLTFNALMDYFKKHSWFGKTLQRKIQENKVIEYSWLDLIAPSLYEYFRQMDYSLVSGRNPVLVISIDSLILKIEGLLRDLCNYSKITTFYQTQDKQGRDISREKDLTALLHEEKMKELFDEDDLLFFKFVLVEQAGYNLRHKIAHSLIFFREYSINYMHLLILLLLRIGKYDFKKPKKDKAS